MLFRLDRFFLDERDIFTFLFGIFLLISLFFHFSLSPFRMESLLVVFLFLIVVRSLVSSARFKSYFPLIMSGIVFCLFLSPYGLAIYLAVALILVAKTNII